MSRETYFVSELFDSINLHNLPNNAHGEFSHDVATRARATQAIVTNLLGPLTQFEAAVEGEARATFKDLTDSITKDINEVLEPRRDSIETALKSAFRALFEAENAEVAESGRTLFELAHLHRVHTDMRLNEQTDAIRKFCMDVEVNHAQALQLSGCQTLFNKLKVANEAVCDAMMRRMDIESGRVTGAMVEARRATDEAYRGLLRGIDAYAYVQGAEAYQPFASFVNQLIKYYTRIYTSAANTGSGGGNSEDSENSENSENSEDSENSEGTEGSELDPALNIKIVFRGTNNQILHEMVVPVDYQIPESEFPAPPEGTHWNFTLADLNLAIGMKNPGDTITVRAQA